LTLPTGQLGVVASWPAMAMAMVIPDGGGHRRVAGNRIKVIVTANGLIFAAR